MRVVVMDTGRGIDAGKVATWRSHLGLDETDELALVAWQAPREQLPLSSHLVCGPHLRLGREAQDWPVRPVEPPTPPDGTGAGALSSVADSAETTGWDADEAVSGARGGLGTAELDEQLTEHAAAPGQAAAADDSQDQAAASDAGAETTPDPLPSATTHAAAPPAPSTSTSLGHLPVYAPRRVRQAVRWRGRRMQRRASRFTQRQVRRVREAGEDVRNLPSTVVSTTLRARSDGVAGEFAVAVVRSRKVAELFRAADVVVPVDQRSQKAAWLLARRHAGPDVIVTLPAAARAVAARRHAG